MLDINLSQLNGPAMLTSNSIDLPNSGEELAWLVVLFNVDEIVEGAREARAFLNSDEMSQSEIVNQPTT
jgi:hypothetical protein